MTPDELAALYDSPESVASHPAFHLLTGVDWSAVSDAYGPATNIPAYLRALNSHEPEHRNFALQALMQNIWHQSTIYSATAVAVPVLFSLLASDLTLDKQSIAFLLATIADGTPPFAQCAEDPTEAEKWRPILEKSGRSLDAEIASGQKIGNEIRQQLAAHMDLLYPFLRAPSPEVRMAVAIAIGRFPDIAARVKSDLQEALESEDDRYVKAEIRTTIDRGTMR